MPAHRKFYQLVCGAVIAISSALIATVPACSQVYTVRGANILKNGTIWCKGGSDSFDQFGPGSTDGHGMKIVREVVENLSGCVMGHGTQSWQGFTLHGLQDVVDDNRAHGEATILCPFTWSSPTPITGDDPSSDSFFTNGQYAAQLAAMATQFKGQSDVWIDPWNEPNFSSKSDWDSCVTTMYNAIRGTGNANIMLIPCNNWDSDQSDYLNDPGWLTGKTNVTGTIHIYNGWDWQTESAIQSQLQAILNAGWPIVVGEIGPDSYVADPIRGIQATIAVHVPTLAWNWDSSDGDQLQNGGSLTAWGEEWFGMIGQYVAGTRPTAPTGLTAMGENARISLSWNPAPGAQSYEIFRGRLPGREGGNPIAGGIATTSFINAGLNKTITYYYTVAAVNSYGKSGKSNEANATPSGTTPIAFAQVDYACPQTPQTSVSVPYASDQIAGDLNVVFVGWGNTTSTVSSVTDSAGNVYHLAIGPTRLTDCSQCIYYASGIKSGSNTVTVTFNTSTVYPDIRVLEYAGVSTLDKSAGGTGTASTSSCGPVTTSTADELIVAGNDIDPGTTGAGSGYTSRVITSPDGNIAEDRTVTSTGSYSATAPLSATGTWVMQMASFR